MSQSDASPPLSSPLSLYRDRRFLWILVAQIVSGIGDFALALAIPVVVYNGTGSTSKLGFAVVSQTLPALLFGLTAGVFVDRLPRRAVMIVTDLARMITVLLLLNLHDLSHLSLTDIRLIYFVGFVSASFSCFFSPARAALLPSLLPRERLLEANTLLSSSTRLTQILGPGLGGLLLFWIHPRGLFVFDALTFFVSAVCLFFVTENFVRREGRKGLPGVWADFLEGFRVFFTHPVLGILIGIMSLAAFFGGIYNALLYAFLRDILHVSGSGYGFLLSGVGCGALLALPLLAGPLKSVPPPRLLAAGLLIMAATGWLLAFAPNATVGAAAMFLGGFGNMVMYMPVVTLFQTAGPPQMLGRINGTTITVGAFFGFTSGLVAGIKFLQPHLHLIYTLIPFAFLISGLLAVPLLTRQANQKPRDEPPSPGPLDAAAREPVSVSEG